MRQQSLFGAFWGFRYWSDKTRWAWSASPWTINRRGGEGWLNEAAFDQSWIRRRNDTVTSFSVWHHGRAPAVATNNFLGKNRSSVEKVILKIRELRWNERGDQRSTCNEEHQHKEHLPPASHSGKDNFFKKTPSHPARTDLGKRTALALGERNMGGENMSPQAIPSVNKAIRATIHIGIINLRGITDHH